MTSDDLISAIEAYADAVGVSPVTVTSRAVGNSRLYTRMKAGGSCSLTTADKVRAFMRDNPAPAVDTQPQDRDAAA